MLLRKFTFVGLFAALASQVQQRESSEARFGRCDGNQVQWQSGDCTNKPLIGKETRNPKNKPLACIKWCKKNGGFKIAALNNQRCVCGNEYREGRVQINNEKCQELCPGQMLTNCGGWNHWWNVFSTDDALGKCVDRSHLDDWPPIGPRDADTRHGRKCFERCRKNNFPIAALSGDWKCRCACGDQESPASTLDCDGCFGDNLLDRVCLIETNEEGTVFKCVERSHLENWDFYPKGSLYYPLLDDTRNRRDCLERCKTDNFTMTTLTEGSECRCGNQENAESSGAADCYTADDCHSFDVELACLIRVSKEVAANQLTGPGKETNMTIVGLSVGAVVLVIVVVLALVLFMRQRKKRTQEKEKEMSDFNPVYATYEVHDDPVAEVHDQNLDYGKVYEGEMSKTTDVNDDYDSLYT